MTESPSDSTDGADHTRDPTTRKSLPRRVGLVVAGILGALVLFYGAAAIIVSFLLDPTALSDWVEPRMEAALNRDVELEGARVRIFPTLGAELQGLEVANLPEFDGPSLAAVDRVRLEVAILPLFRGRVRVDEVRVEAPRIHLAVDESGVSNFGDLVPEGREVEADEEGSPLELAIREIVVREGDFSYESAPDTLRMSLTGLEADASVERSATTGWQGTVEARSDAFSLGHPALGGDPLLLDGPGLRGEATAGEEFEWVEIADGFVVLGGAELALSGRVEDLKEPTRTLDLALEADALSIPGVFELLPDTAASRVPGRGTGTLAVDLRVRGAVGPDARPLVRGQIRLQDVGFVGRSEEVLAEGIAGLVEVQEDAVDIRELRGSALGGPFSVGGTVSPDSVLAFALSVSAQPDLATASGLVTLPEGARLAGAAEADLDLTGTVREPAATSIEGFVAASGIRYEAPTLGVPVRVDSGRVEFRGDRATWNEIPVDLGPDRLRVSGTLGNPLGMMTPGGEPLPRLEARVSGARLDLDRILPARSDTAVTYGRIAFARMGGRTIQGRTAEEWATDKGLALPDSLPVAGEVNIALDTLISTPFRLEDLEATVAFNPTLVGVTESRFVLYGGQVRSGFQLGIGDDRETQPFSLTVATEGIRGGDFLSTTSSLGRYVSGLLDLDLDVAGELDRQMLPVPGTVSGDAATDLRDGRLEETPLTRGLSRALSLASLASPTISRWTARMAVEGSTVRFLESDLATDVGPLSYGGSIGLDGSLDLGLRLSLASARVDSLALQQSGLLGAVAGRLAAVEGGGGPRLGIGIGIRGTLSEPRLSPQASLATGDLGDALEAAAREPVRQLRDTAQARIDAARDSATGRARAARDTVAERIEAEREAAEERARQQAEDARRELQDRARGFLGGFLGGGQSPDTAADDGDGGGDVPPDTAASESGEEADSAGTATPPDSTGNP